MEHLVATYTFTLQELDAIVPAIWTAIRSQHTILLYGEMGAGKTTLVYHLCQYLGVEEDVNSPTFSLVNEYTFRDGQRAGAIYHMDLYRLNSITELIQAGLEDTLTQARAPGNYAFVEWPQKAVNLIPAPYIVLNLSTVTPEIRRLEIWEMS